MKYLLDTCVISELITKNPNPRVVRFIDSLIAATVLTHEMTLITRNVSDFLSTDVEILNPWNAEK